MQVKMITTAAGADWSAQAGAIVDVPDDEGKALCKGGYASPVKAKSVEQADAQPDAEKATTRGGRKGKPKSKK